MADFLDFLLSSPTKSPLPLEITSATTLQDIIAATIQSNDTDPVIDSTPDQTNKPTNDSDDDEALAAAILAEATAHEPEPTRPTTQRSYSATSPASETRLADSLFGLLGTPPPEINPAYSELQLLIKSELKQQTLPETLLGLLKPKASIFSREQQLQRQFAKLEQFYPTQIQQLSSFFKYQSAVIETERYQSLHQQATRPHLRDSINAQFDEQVHQVINRVQLSVDNLEHTVQDQTPYTSMQRPVTTCPSTLKSRPTLSRRSVQLMEDWYQLNIAHPYPDSAVIQSIAQQGNIREEQVKKWFANKRSRSQNTHSRSIIHSRKMSTKYQRNLYQPY